MKRFLLPALSLFAFAAPLRAAAWEKEWKEVREFNLTQNYQSALAVLQRIETAAIGEKAWPDAAKAIRGRINVETVIHRDEPTLSIRLMDEALAKSPAELKPVLLAMQATLHFEYFMSHAWEIMRRTATAGDAGSDMETWDLTRLMKEVDTRFQKSLENAAALKSAPVAAWNDPLVGPGLPDSYQPTLYDFVARQALEYYAGDWQGIIEIKTEDPFEFMPESPALGNRAEFLAWRPVAGTQIKRRVIQLYQALLTFHKDDADPGARVLIDVERLEWAAAAATGDATLAEDRKLEQLRAIVTREAAHEVSLRAAASQAQSLIKRNKPAGAHALLAERVAAHPKSPFAPRCRNLTGQIEEKKLSASTELIWNAAGPEIAFTARNLDRVFFRLILVSKAPDPNFESMLDDEKQINKILRKKPARSWALNLPETKDFLDQSHRTPAPVDDVKPGFYLLAVSGNADFTRRRNQISFAPVLVSPLALLSEVHSEGEKTAVVEARVLDAVNGDPVAGAEVSVWASSDNSEKILMQKAAKTDADGFVRIQGAWDDVPVVLASHDGNSAFSGDIDSSRDEEKLSNNSTFFFTDRAIYRPGQTIQFKGIHVRCDTKKNDYRPLPDVKRQVILRDANDREVAKLAAVTNAFGSFNGSFTAPVTGLTGGFTIKDGAGETHLQVEEYKRPKFTVEVLPPAVAPKLDETVAVKVKASGYTGAPVDGAKVAWRVRRTTEWFPRIRQASRFYGRPEGSEIAHGETLTAADGTVEIKFPALPDKSADPKDDPWFYYAIHADVTDTAGETRSIDDGVRVGFVAMKATVRVETEEFQTAKKPVEFFISTTTLDNEPLQAAGRLVVHRLAQPEKVHRPWLDGEHDSDDKAKDLSDPESWETGEVVQREEVATNEKGESTARIKLSAGAWRAVFESKDRLGKKITAQADVIVVDPALAKFPVKVPFWAGVSAGELEPGAELNILWGSGNDRARALVEIEHRGKIVQHFWNDPARTQHSASFKVTEDHRGGFSVRITQMRDNRLSVSTNQIMVPWSNKDLTLKWEHLTSKLQPGAKEQWSVSITGPRGEKAAAEMAAVLYDASLDALTAQHWPESLNCFRYGGSPSEPGFYNEFVDFEDAVTEWYHERESENTGFRSWAWRTYHGGGEGGGRGSGVGSGGYVVGDEKITRGLRFGSDPLSRNAIDALIAGGTTDASVLPAAIGGATSPPHAEAAFSSASPAMRVTSSFLKTANPAAAEIPAITARKNMHETAFFFPQLLSAEDGTVKMEFTMPEAVTSWRFLGFAHDKKLRSGLIEGKTVTAKDLMVQPNPPRFLREGDTVEFTAKITNQSDTPQHGTARLSLADAAALTPVDEALGLKTPEQPFDVPAKESRTVAWRITVPDGQGFLTWKAVAGTETVSDGEEGWLPVLPRRVLLTESLPLSMSKVGEKEYTFQKLTDSAASPTLRHQSLTVQMVSQPSWYAVMALPYLMEFPHECSEQIFNRFYANALAQHVANRDPKIRRTFDLWRDAQPQALESPLLKNQELKSLLIEETPWLRDAAKETEQRRKVGLLFDANRLDSETARVLAKLEGMQHDDGAWPWFPGGHSNEFITLYIVAGFGKLQHLGVKVKTEMAVEALDWLDHWLEREHKAALKSDRLRKDGKTGDHLGSDIALYLYARSFFLEQRPVPEEQKPALDYFLAQARTNWPDKGRMTQAHTALGLLRFGDKPAAAKILGSLKERSVVKEDLGRYWPEAPNAWRWDAAPIETQALLIEAFRDIAKDPETADECALWLLKQKQTQAWPTTKATADACYALILGGTARLSSDAPVSISLAGSEVKPEKVEAGTGFFEKRFTAAEIKPDMGIVKLTKPEKGAAWGSVHWQYLEDVSKVTAHEGTPLKVTKSLFIKTNTGAGPELRPVQGKVKVGDELVVRLELRTDRDMEFVHLKDQRPSSVEPVNVLSAYKWQDGLGYYESTRDTASHFFVDALPKGTCVFEYSTRVQLRGACQSGLAELQCMYAPEFNSHSASTVLEAE